MSTTFQTVNASLPLRSDMLAGMQREWDRLSQPGTWWTGEERVAIAEQARAAHAGLVAPATSLSQATVQIARQIATDAHDIDRNTVDALESEGIGQEAYVEMVGIIARLTAIDTAVRGMGSDLVPLPTPVSGEPSREVVPSAKRRAAFVPMVGGSGATNALSAVPPEDRAQADLHGSLYLSYADMGNFGVVKGIPRWQMELAAATTSYINHCVF